MNLQSSETLTGLLERSYFINLRSIFSQTISGQRRPAATLLFAGPAPGPNKAILTLPRRPVCAPVSGPRSMPRLTFRRADLVPRLFRVRVLLGQLLSRTPHAVQDFIVGWELIN